MKRRNFLFGSVAAGMGTMVHGALASAGNAMGTNAVEAAARRSVVFVYLHGGASQIDTFDPKPGRPTGGPFRAIRTAIDGVRFSEHLPQLAKRANRMAVIRSLTSKEGNHNRARYLMHTGFVPQGGVQHPGFGSAVARANPAGPLPGYVAINGPGQTPGYLGAAYAPFPVGNPTQPVRNLSANHTIDERRLDRRMALWRALESDFAKDRPSPQVVGQRQVGEQAVAMMRSSEAVAFDLSREPARAHERYGAHAFGQGCLMARRLIDAGVPFVEVGLRGWDTHRDNFPRVKDLSAQLDTGLSALLDDLVSSGRMGETLVMVAGDFGRTPKINANGGRDHYPRASSLLMAGAGIRGGIAVGQTDADGYEVVQRPVKPADIYATVAKVLGVSNEMHDTPLGRPVMTFDAEGEPLEELI